MNLLGLKDLKLGDEFYYRHLPLCVIDTVFSIGIKYSAVKDVVRNFYTYANWGQFRNPMNSNYPQIPSQHSISEFINIYKKNNNNFDYFADSIYKNRCRTSTRNGILKAEAVYRFAGVLQKNGIEYFQDIPKILNNPVLLSSIENQIKTIPGQRSGISFRYFLMLAGDCNSIKPDRMVMRFLSNIYGKNINTPHKASVFMQDMFNKLKGYEPNLTLRKLDYAIWLYMKKLLTIGSLGVDKRNDTWFIYIYTNNQKIFEDSLKKLLDYIKKSKKPPKRIVFQLVEAWWCRSGF